MLTTTKRGKSKQHDGDDVTIVPDSATHSLAKFVQPSIKIQTPEGTTATISQASLDDVCVFYLGKNSNETDRTAFIENIEVDFVANGGKAKLSSGELVAVGINTLLDGAPLTDSGRTPSLKQLLDEDAYRDNDVSTYDSYLGDSRTRAEERDFRFKLTYLRSLFGGPLDAERAMAVAEYMLGPKHEDDDDESDDESEEEEEEEEEDDDEESESASESNISESEVNDDDESEDEEEEQQEEKKRQTKQPAKSAKRRTR